MDDPLMFVDFVNSDWYDGAGHSQDRLTVPGWLAVFARKWLSGAAPAAEADSAGDDLFSLRELPDRRVPSPADLASLDRLRTVIRQIIDRVEEGEPVPPALVRRLNDFLDAGPIRYRLITVDGQPALHPVADPRDAAAIAAAVALSMSEFLARGDVRRLKQCDNGGCRWVFYDGTKNASRRWCDSRLCGNVDKVRRYRARHAPT